MSHWGTLQAELDRWSAERRSATLWWRDDDAEQPTPALERLLGLAERSEVPVALAVVPARAGRELARRIAGDRGVSVLQHGYAHCNHAPTGARACEFGADRPRAEVRAELAEGCARLQALIGKDALPVLVPPWNRIAAELLDELPALGLAGLSAFRARASAEPVRGLRQANCHVDLIDWRVRCFVGEAKALGELVAHLAARRAGAVDAAEPTGVLTHHLAFDEGCWGFLEELLRRTRSHPAVRWLNVAEGIWRR